MKHPGIDESDLCWERLIMRSFAYPAIPAQDSMAGDFAITFRDFPKAITQAENMGKAGLQGMGVWLSE